MAPRTLLSLLIAVGAGLRTLGAEAAAPVPPAAPAANVITLTASAAESEKLRAGDRLRFQIVEDGSAVIDLLIGEDGRIEVPYLGFVEAAGLSPDLLRVRLSEALEKDFYHKATVRLSVIQRSGKGVNMGRVYIAGEVRRIGQVEISKSEHVLLSQVMLANGGFTDFADLRRVKIFRRQTSGAVETIVVNLRDIIELGKINLDVPMLDGDFVLVGSKLVSW
jgi:protein involved in polysaccharide export with SLBB domain